MAEGRSGDTFEDRSQPSTLRFATFVDNMGEPLDYGFEHAKHDVDVRDVEEDSSLDPSDTREDFDADVQNKGSFVAGEIGHIRDV